MDEAFPPIYCIHYDGIYLQPVTPPGGGRMSNGGTPDSGGGGWKSFRYIVQPRVVKRRFKEFINLESRFESNSKLGPLVRDHQLERPTTWLMGSDGVTVESRRAFLERWITSLCDRPALATSPELRKFMAYEDDGLGEFSSSSAAVPGPGGPGCLPSNNEAGATHSSSNKIDKFLSKTVSGVIHTIKDALPHFDDDDVQVPSQNSASNSSDNSSRSQLLLPMLYAPSGVRVSPVWTPVAESPGVVETNNAVDSRQHRKHSLAYDVDFRFSTSEGEVSEFENTLEFHVQRCDHLEKLALHNHRSEESNQSIRGGAESVLLEMRYKNYPSGESQDLNSSLIETALQAVPIGLVAKGLLIPAWVSQSEAFRRIVESTVAEVIGYRVDAAVNVATDGDDAWATHLKYLISALWIEDDTRGDANSPSSQPDSIKITRSRQTPPTTSFASSEVIADRLEFLASDRRVNEELFLMLLDLLVAHLTDKQ